MSDGRTRTARQKGGTKARERFFESVEAHGERTARDERTFPLFPLWLILDADGTLAGGLRPLVDRTQA